MVWQQSQIHKSLHHASWQALCTGHRLSSLFPRSPLQAGLFQEGRELISSYFINIAVMIAKAMLIMSIAELKENARDDESIANLKYFKIYPAPALVSSLPGS